MLRRLLLLFALLFVPALAQARGIDPELVAEGASVAGGEVELAILMHPKPGWHGYWLNPGDAGLPMEVSWTLPAGYSVGALRYPVPTRLTIAGIMNYVYESDYAVLARLKVPAGARGTVPVRAKARWLACTDKICVPEEGEFALSVPLGRSGAPDPRFNQWRRALPRPLAAQAHFELTGESLRLGIPLPRDVALDDPYFFPADDGALDYAGKQHFARNGDLLIAELPRREGSASRFAGVLALGPGRGLAVDAIPGAVPKGGSAINGTGTDAVLWAMLGALVGGILLNLMPCVFPILALKALHLARSGGEARNTRSDALAYAAGAVLGTGALGAALLAIRAGGEAAGWAFQLQDPRTMMLLLLLATAITANLIGLFQLPALGGSARPAGSFGTGALAAFVATPCAGPFLGAALGTALVLPLYGALAVFAALGLGLAIPFLAIAFVPALRRAIPAPGRWMQRLQRFLAIPMAATAVAALWLLYRLAGQQALWIGVAAAAILLLGLLVVGLSQRRGARASLIGLALAGAGAVAAIALVPSASAPGAAFAGAGRWSEAAVARKLAAGHPAFVYFTADWCLTCKVNEGAAIERDNVRDAFKEAGVATFAGDWTNGDPEITRFIENRGRAGVPLYLWYEPSGAAPEELPQVLTPAMLTSRARRER